MSVDTDKFANDMMSAFENVGAAFKSITSAGVNMAKSINALAIQQLISIETDYFYKFHSANFFTRWYYKKKYRKARLARIQFQRSIKLC